MNKTRIRELLAKAERFAREGKGNFKLKNALRALRFAADEKKRDAALRTLEKVLIGIEAGQRTPPAVLAASRTGGRIGFTPRELTRTLRPATPCPSEATAAMVRLANGTATAADRGWDELTESMVEQANAPAFIY